MIEPGKQTYNQRSEEFEQISRQNEAATLEVELLDKRVQKYNPAQRLALLVAEKVFRKDPLGRKRAKLASGLIWEAYNQAQTELERSARNGVLVDLVELKFDTNPADKGFMAEFTYDKTGRLKATSDKTDSVDLFYSDRVQSPKVFMENGKLTTIFVPIGQTIRHHHLLPSQYFVSRWDLNLTTLPRTLNRDSILGSLPKSEISRAITILPRDRRN